jgi:hypothetical protein
MPNPGHKNRAVGRRGQEIWKSLFFESKGESNDGHSWYQGFFEWAIIAEDEVVEDFAIQVANIADLTTSEEQTKIASDERLHIERMKKGVLGMEGWEMGGGGRVRDVIFGASDGLVSILALVAGVYGAITESHPILIAGIAGAVAGTGTTGRPRNRRDEAGDTDRISRIWH